MMLCTCNEVAFTGRGRVCLHMVSCRYSDDHGTASHRSGRMYAGGDEDAHSEVSGPALTAADTVDADDIEMSLETVFDG